MVHRRWTNEIMKEDFPNAMTGKTPLTAMIQKQLLTPFRNVDSMSLDLELDQPSPSVPIFQRLDLTL